MSTAAILQAFTELNPAQQIQLVEDMWDRVALSPEPLALNNAQKKTLRARKKALGGMSPNGRSWEKVFNSLLKSR
jgi:putative addiction module component (TIGR02574 family)